MQWNLTSSLCFLILFSGLSYAQESTSNKGHVQIDGDLGSCRDRCRTDGQVVTSGSSSRPELNPELQQYQDISTCFPLSETWYAVYRNFKSDPLFGGTAKCIRYTEIGPSANDAHPILIKFGNQSVQTTATFQSSPGYVGKNILSITPSGGNASITTFVAYVDCDKCSILRTTYINNSTCALLKPKSQINKSTTSCDFIFDLLCGTSQKYYIYDESCQVQDNLLIRT
ncbi:unnamed protein product [Ixodes persulcatus]